MAPVAALFPSEEVCQELSGRMGEKMRASMGKRGRETDAKVVRTKGAAEWVSRAGREKQNIKQLGQWKHGRGR